MSNTDPIQYQSNTLITTNLLKISCLIDQDPACICAYFIILLLCISASLPVPFCFPLSLLPYFLLTLSLVIASTHFLSICPLPISYHPFSMQALPQISQSAVVSVSVAGIGLNVSPKCIWSDSICDNTAKIHIYKREPILVSLPQFCCLSYIHITGTITGSLKSLKQLFHPF